MTNVIIYYLLQQSEGVALRMSRCKQKLTEESVLYIQKNSRSTQNMVERPKTMVDQTLTTYRNVNVDPNDGRPDAHDQNYWSMT